MKDREGAKKIFGGGEREADRPGEERMAVLAWP